MLVIGGNLRSEGGDFSLDAMELSSLPDDSLRGEGRAELAVVLEFGGSNGGKAGSVRSIDVGGMSNPYAGASRRIDTLRSRLGRSAKYPAGWASPLDV
jgi:hypothetical protein